MRVLGACSLGGHGHLGPLCSVLDPLSDRGDAVAAIGAEMAALPLLLDVFPGDRDAASL